MGVPVQNQASLGEAAYSQERVNEIFKASLAIDRSHTPVKLTYLEIGERTVAHAPPFCDVELQPSFFLATQYAQCNFMPLNTVHSALPSEK